MQITYIDVKYSNDNDNYIRLGHTAVAEQPDYKIILHNKSLVRNGIKCAK